ncbi:MAG: chromate transporter [Fervidobacterium sp.]|uniref:Chromate transporter n=1 Tax=Fervidobacterium gondwanense DSM 13020 TaxID=1121883 RepID=A0A1M7S4F0_FERGO|nr:chromate transporter [Fervidobacterium gondwanense]UXF00786.1 chromate transporter [Fervidobacterium riparium]SHN53321.1 chromate transporter [Fervidobacterium gondwanense DSM 13020]
MICIKLFTTFLQIGAVSFGGGYSILKTIIHYVVDTNKWLSVEEFNEIVAISQSTPGPIGINAATFVGYKMGGIFGSLVATLSVILVPVISTLTLYLFYRRHSQNTVVQFVISKLKPIVLAMIASAALSFLSSSFGSVTSFIITLLAIFILLYTKIDVVLLLLISGTFGYIFFR